MQLTGIAGYVMTFYSGRGWVARVSIEPPGGRMYYLLGYLMTLPTTNITWCIYIYVCRGGEVVWTDNSGKILNDQYGILSLYAP